jgi:hypothetical protein
MLRMIGMRSTGLLPSHAGTQSEDQNSTHAHAASYMTRLSRMIITIFVISCSWANESMLLQDGLSDQTAHTGQGELGVKRWGSTSEASGRKAWGNAFKHLCCTEELVDRVWEYVCALASSRGRLVISATGTMLPRDLASELHAYKGIFEDNPATHAGQASASNRGPAAPPPHTTTALLTRKRTREYPSGLTNPTPPRLARPTQPPTAPHPPNPAAVSTSEGQDMVYREIVKVRNLVERVMIDMQDLKPDVDF